MTQATTRPLAQIAPRGLDGVWNTQKQGERKYYSGKQKRHTQKAQGVVVKKTKQIVCTFTGRGREHDFKLFRRSALTLHPDLNLKADKGYQGVKHLHANSQTPHRKPPKKEVSQEQKSVVVSS